MLSRYRVVYVKPNVGMHGDGVIRTERLGGGQFLLHAETRRRKFASYSQLYKALQSARSSRRPHLAQQGVDLQRYHSRRFDIRVMVQRSPGGGWETTGMLARVAHPDRVVTNCKNGGHVESLERIYGTRLSVVRRKLSRIGKRTAAVLRRRYPRIKEIGLDVGLDATTAHPWIIEVNTSPDPFLFMKLPDWRPFRKIMNYARAYSKNTGKRVKRGRRR